MSVDRRAGQDLIDYVASRPSRPRKVDELQAEVAELRRRCLRLGAQYQDLAEEAFELDAEIARLRGRLLEAVAHDHPGLGAPDRPAPSCARCSLELEFADQPVRTAA